MQIGEDGVCGGFGGGGGDEFREPGDQLVEAREDVEIEVTGAVGAVLAADEVEQHVFAEIEEAGVVELETDVWCIDFEQDKTAWKAYGNLSSNVKNIPLANGFGLELRPYETMVLKS